MGLHQVCTGITHINILVFRVIIKPGTRRPQRAPGFLVLLLSANVSMCVSAPEAINN